MAKVSIIIPVYNVEKYLSECLDSVVNQTFKDIEIICVNDGSTDTSLDILNEYAKKDNRIKIFSQENQGVSEARNKGINESTGEYICFLDSDDWYKKYYVEKQYNQIIKTGADISICSVSLYNNNTHQYKDRKLHDIKNITKSDREYCTYKDLKSYLFTNFEPALRMYKKSFFIENNLYYPKGVIFEDVTVSIKSIVLASKITFVKECLFYYRMSRNGSIMYDVKNKKNITDLFIFLKKVEIFLKKQNKYKELEYYFLLFVLRQVKLYKNIKQKEIKKEYEKQYKDYFKYLEIKKKIKQYPKLKNIYLKNFSRIRFIYKKILQK